MSLRRARRWLAIPLGIMLAVSAVASASATMLEGESGPYSGEDAFSYDDCGFWVDVTATFGGTAHIRVGKGDLESGFFAHDNYWWREVHVRRDTGETFILSGNGLFQETTATHIGGTIFEFTAVNAGQPFRVFDADGNLVLRDRGVIRETILFDTLGDDTPGGEFLGSLSFHVGGPHPGLDLDICTLFSEP